MSSPDFSPRRHGVTEETGVILSEAAVQAERRISRADGGAVAREIPRPAGENAGLRDDAFFHPCVLVPVLMAENDKGQQIPRAEEWRSE